MLAFQKMVSGKYKVRILWDLKDGARRYGELRSGLRARVEQSPICDCPRFTQALEGLYRQMWKNWCFGRPGA